MKPAVLEKRLWELDQRINWRGIQVDTELARAAMAACQREKAELDERVKQLTQGRITSGTQRDRILSELAECNVSLPDLKASTLAGLDRTELSGIANELIEARERVSKASTAKYDRILKAVGPDGRLRGALQFAGAMRTARWAGRIFQPHNLPRPQRKPDEVVKAAQVVKAGAAEIVTDNVHQLASDVLRSLLIAPKGHELFVADWNAIEGRFVAWLCSETWKLEAYADPNRDIYVETYRALFGLPASQEVTKDQRQQGKAFELSMGYQGGVGALATTAATYGVDLDKLARGAWRVAPGEVRDRAKYLYEFALERGEPIAHAAPKRYVGLEAAKIMWRNLSPNNVRLWKLYEGAALRALNQRGWIFKAGRCQFLVRGGFLLVRLPSGRCIFYAKPKVHEDDRGKPYITYLGPYGGRISFYGGKCAEQACQSGARDILALNLLRLDNAGYPIVMHVHDETIVEVPDSSDLSLDTMYDIMATPPRWAPNLPLQVEGYQATRYRKE